MQRGAAWLNAQRCGARPPAKKVWTFFYIAPGCCLTPVKSTVTIFRDVAMLSAAQRSRAASRCVALSRPGYSLSLLNSLVGLLSSLPSGRPDSRSVSRRRMGERLPRRRVQLLTNTKPTRSRPNGDKGDGRCRASLAPSLSPLFTVPSTVTECRRGGRGEGA